MITINDKRLCSGCTACKSICPKKCIVMKPDEEGFLYPNVNMADCVNCGACENVCPILNTSFSPKEGFPDAYLVYDRDENWRMKSAAGGGFASIARYFIEQYHGVVFGARYDDDYSVYHTSCDTVEDLQRYQKSKYVQSNPRNTFIEVKNCLIQGKYVLYSGTPCQIYGLKSFLGGYSNSEQLYCIDLSCHGVPSPKVFRKYIAFLEEQEKSDISSFTMRGKIIKKNAYAQGFDIKFKNGAHRFLSHTESYYGRCFWGEISSRPSCYNCHFKTIWRTSDITLGDCWFFDCFVPGECDSLGVTMALAHSEKGRDLILNSNDLIKYEVDSEKLIKANGGMIYSSAKENPNRTEFFELIDKDEFGKVVERYFPTNQQIYPRVGYIPSANAPFTHCISHANMLLIAIAPLPML